MGNKMFDCVTETWNPVSGCLHNCVYCWARRLAETKLHNVERYRRGFIPRLNENEFTRKFKSGSTVFVSDMGDLLGDWVDEGWIKRVLNHIIKFPETVFLLLTKNPKRFLEFEIPENCIIGTTLETNRDTAHVSKAPRPAARFQALDSLNHDSRLRVSIEPIMQFDTDVFVKWIKTIEPEFVYVGYDNYGNNLCEPSLKKTRLLMQLLQDSTKVIPKSKNLKNFIS